jgi:nitrite reductase/ring-hydroxylating ferredoxin subunit
MKYVKIAETKDIPKNTMRVFKLEGIDILVVNVEGEFYAFENRCPHLGYPLYYGNLNGEFLICGFHYAKFNIKTGKSLGTVTQETLKMFKTTIRNSSLLIELNNKDP